MKTALIITAYIENPEKLPPIKASGSWDLILCADGGWRYAEMLSLTPDVLIGDMDSDNLPRLENEQHYRALLENAPAAPGVTVPRRPEVIRLPMEKDMTDTEAALDLAIQRGAEDVTILGGIGGRFDHTLGNLSLLARYAGRASVCLLDGRNLCFMKGPGTYHFTRAEYAPYRYLSLIPHGGDVHGLTIRGCKYPLTDHNLTPDNTLGISNEITEEEAGIRFREGLLLFVFSN